MPNFSKNSPLSDYLSRGSTRVPRVGRGVSPRPLAGAKLPGFSTSQGFRRDAENSTRDACAPQGTNFKVVIERDTKGWLVASVPALAGCHTQARSLDKLMVRIREAVELCLEVSPAKTAS